MWILTRDIRIHSHKDFKDKSRPPDCRKLRNLIACHSILRCLHTGPEEDWITRLYTYHPVLFISTLTIPENETIIPAGHIVLFRPKELQKYEFYGKDKTQIYWLHIYRKRRKNTLRNTDLQTIKESLMLERLLNMNRFSKGLLQSFKDVRTIMRKCSCFCYDTFWLYLTVKITTEHVIRNEFLDSQMDTAIT
mgnify:CR=1 FL=1